MDFDTRIKLHIYRVIAKEIFASVGLDDPFWDPKSDQWKKTD